MKAICVEILAVGTQEPTMNYLVTDKMVVLFQFRRVNQQHAISSLLSSEECNMLISLQDG